MKLFELKRLHTEALNKAEAVLASATNAGRNELTALEQSSLDTHMARAKGLQTEIQAVESQNTLVTQFRKEGPGMLFGGGGFEMPTSSSVTSLSYSAQPHEATQFRAEFASWMSNALTAIGGGRPAMEATAPTGVVSIGSGTGLDSIAITVPTQVLAYLPSYFALDSFGLAGATQFFTDHTRPLVQPILSAGAADAVYAENAAPGTS